MRELGDARAVKPLIAALEDENSAVREAAAETLGQLGNARVVKPLIAALRDRNSSVRKAAAEALGRLGDTRAVEPLIAALGERGSDMCKAAVEALGRLGDTRAMVPLIAALRDEVSAVREAAAEALGQIGKPPVDLLIGALKDEDSRVREAAAQTLARVGWEPIPDATGVAYWIAIRDWDQCVALGASAVAPLLATLGDKNDSVRKGAAEALGRLGDARAVDPLIVALRDKVSVVREAAAEALAKIGTPGVDPLVAILEDEDWQVREAAAKTLDRLGWEPELNATGAAYWIAIRDWDQCVSLGESAVEPLITILGDRNSSVRQAVAKVLMQLGDTCTVDPLITALGDERSAVRAAAAEALGRLADIIAALGDEDSAVRAAAAEELGRLAGIRAVHPLIAALRDEDRAVRAAAAKTLGRLGDARAVDPLIAALGDEDSTVREAVMDTLGQLGDAHAVDPLTTALRDEVSVVREAAVEALAKIGTPGVDPLVAILEDEDWQVREAAAKTLDRLGWEPEPNAMGAAYWIARQDWDQCMALGESAVEPLIDALRHRNSSVRQAVARALGQLGDARAVNPLVASLGDEDSAVRAGAAEALDKLLWKPQTDEQQVVYWIAKEDWERCAAIGEPAISPLVDLIDSRSSVQLPPGAQSSIRQRLAEHFASYPSVIEALQRRGLILVVDDEHDVLELYEYALRLAGFEVELAADGIEALEKVSLQQPDLILLDIRMPKISGYEVLRQLKEDPATRAIPVVIVSAKGQEIEIRQGLASGAVDYLVKPVARDELIDRVGDVLRGSRLGVY